MALPHLSQRVVLGAGSGLAALLHLEEGFEAAGPTPDGVAGHRMLFFVAPTPRAHLDLLARLSRAVASGPFRQARRGGGGGAALWAAAAEVDRGGPEVGAGT